jgi:hypothetical protein
VAAPRGHDVELCEVALETWGGDREAEAQDRETIRAGACEQDRGVAAGEELPDALGDLRRFRRRLVELGVEVVHQPADSLGIGELGAADGVIAHRASPGATSPASYATTTA